MRIEDAVRAAFSLDEAAFPQSSMSLALCNPVRLLRYSMGGLWKRPRLAEATRRFEVYCETNYHKVS